MGIPAGLFKAIREISMLRKKDEFKRERTLRRVAKIIISKDCDEMAEVDFVDYGCPATFPRLQDTFRDTR